MKTITRSKLMQLSFVFAALVIACSAQAELKVVSTLTMYADLLESIGGDKISVSYIARPRFNPHFIEPRPTDVLKVKRADLFVHTGLDLELWRGPLLNAAANLKIMPGTRGELNISKGINLLEKPHGHTSRAMGDIHMHGNPHFQLDPRNGLIMARSIKNKLCELDEQNCIFYEDNYLNFKNTLDAKLVDWLKQLKSIRGKEIVSYHKGWTYLTKFAGISVSHNLEPKPGISPTPHHVKKLEEYMKANGINTIVQASYFPRDTADAIANETGANVHILCQNVGELDSCKDFFALFDHNIGELRKALS